MRGLPPTSLNHRRDSDSSLASSRPFSFGVPQMESAISTINSFLASQNFPISFKPSSSPSAKDIHLTLKFLLSLLDFPTSKVEDDLPILMKYLNYPFKINKSIIKSPAAPHQWPSILSLIHWLVVISNFHLSFSSSTDTLHSNNVLSQYTLSSYLHFIKGDDDTVKKLRTNICDKILNEKSITRGKLTAAEQNVAELETELERRRSAPSRKVLLEKEMRVLEDDENKSHKNIDELGSQIEVSERVLVEKEKLLEAKVLENEKKCGENEELKRRVELQSFNVRDVERMKRELQAAERDAEEAKLARNAWEERCWDVDHTLAHKFKDLEALSIVCNQSLKRLFSSSPHLYYLLKNNNHNHRLNML